MSEELDEFTDEDYARLLSSSQADKPKHEVENPSKKWVLVRYAEWSGTRNHPQKEEIEEYGSVEGDWFTSYSGNRKKVSGRWFNIIKEFDTEDDLRSEKDDKDRIKDEQEAARKQKEAEKFQREKDLKQRQRLYKAYIKKYPDVSVQKFYRNEQMIAEAEKILEQYCAEYEKALKQLQNERSQQIISREEFAKKRSELEIEYECRN